MTRYIVHIIALLFLGFLSGCNLEKDIEVNIPDFGNGYVIEAYMAPDVPFCMLVSRSTGFFETIDTNLLNQESLNELLANGLEGYIEVNGNRYLLQNEIFVAPGTTNIYNYRLKDTVRFRANDILTLRLSLPSGETVQSKAKIPIQRPVDSIRLVENDKSKYRELSFFTTDSTKSEYFRRQLIQITKGKGTLIQDFIIDNKAAKRGLLAFGSGFEFKEGDTLISRVIHIEKAYYDFINSVTGSVSANTNPFSQPGIIVSNITGSDKVIGIFTGINQSEILKRIVE